MLHINRVTLLGHAGRDPELRNLPSGEKTAIFSLATTHRWKRRDGAAAETCEVREATEWHRIVVYGGAVKAVETMVKKGATVLVEGRLAVRAFTDKQERERQVTEIVVAGPQGMVNVLSGRRAAEGGDAPAPDEAG